MDGLRTDERLDGCINNERSRKMKTITVELIKLEADTDKTMTNGEVYSKEVYLGINDSVENWNEIDDADVPERKELLPFTAEEGE